MTEVRIQDTTQPPPHVPETRCTACREIVCRRQTWKYSGSRREDYDLWRTWSTYPDLVHSARDGCDICKFILHALSYHGRTDEAPIAIFCRSRLLGYQLRVDQGNKPDSWYLYLDTSPGRPYVSTAISADSTSIYSRIQSWLDTCFREHNTCSLKTQPSRLPTRLIDVTFNHPHFDCRLVRSSDLLQGKDVAGQLLDTRYIALSYCWGMKVQRLMTTQATIADRYRGFSIRDLPRTLQDAVTVCRRLRIQYLWVDALCIIQPSQNDRGDWANESRSMASVYGNACFSLAVSEAGDCEQGFMHDRPAGADSRVRPCYIPVADGAKPVWLWPRLERWEDGVERKPLERRAWTFQERGLASRTVFWTYKGLFWECSSIHASEWEPKGETWYRESASQLNNSWEYSPKLFFKPHDKHKHNLVDSLWQAAVSKYTQRNLTYEGDRLVAIEGLSDIILRESEDGTYLSGHFLSTLHHSILWYGRPGDVFPSKLAGFTKNRLFPSWSWASLPLHVGFQRVYTTTAEIHPLLGISKASAGAQHCLELSITGRVRTVKLNCPDWNKPDQYSGYFGEKRISGWRQVWYDGVLQPFPMEFPWVEIGREPSKWDKGDEDWEPGKIIGLLLRPSSSTPARFERIGLISTTLEEDVLEVDEQRIILT